MQKCVTLLLCCLFAITGQSQQLTKFNDRFYKLEASGAPATDYLFKTQLLESGFHSLKEIDCREDAAGNQHCRYEILAFNIPIKGYHLTTHYNQRSETTDYLIPRTIPRTSNISRDGAKFSMLNAADIVRQKTPANEYKYLGPSPSGTETGLIYVPADYNFEKPNWVLAYEIDVRTSHPFTSKRLTVNASNGDIIFKENKLCAFVPGTAVTRYHGTKTIETTAANGGFVLSDQTRGTGIITKNLNTGNLFFDADNIWDNANAEMDEVAGDVHWGSGATFDFYNDQLSYHGIDGNGRGINANVHLDDANAFWDGTATSYGDGLAGSRFDQPLTYINIVGHEITHAVTEFSSGLIYSGESGAMNESISDIIGVSVENHTNPGSVDWLMGEEASSTGSYFRNIANPKELEMADTYNGEFWNDGAGVHTNSSIGNYWFYLLVTGESATNDLNYEYEVTAIGWEKAFTIAHNTWTQYLSPSSTYEDCALFSVEVAENLYGNCSEEVEQVFNAWAAVGVLSSGAKQDFAASSRTLCELPGTINFTATGDITNPTWDFGDGNQSTDLHPVYSYPQNGVYTVTLSGEDCNNEPFTIEKPNFITVNDQSNSCDTITMINNVTVINNQCAGIIVDDGGENAYGNSVFSTLDLEIPDANGYNLHLDFFETEGGYDYLKIYGHNGSDFVLLGNYSGIQTGESLTVENNRIRIVWDTDGSVTRSGFVVSWQCIEPQIPVANFSTSDTISCGNYITVTDLSTGPATSWSWQLDGVEVSTESQPTIDLVNPGTYDLGLIACNSAGCDSITFTEYITYDPSLPKCQVVIMEDGLEETSILCEGKLVDDGDLDGDYSNGADASLEIAVPNALGYILELISFSTETGYDELVILVDNGDGYQFYQELEGTLNPTTINLSGSRIKLVWNTDGSATRPGFEINWMCQTPGIPVADLSATAEIACSNMMQLTDNSTNFPNNWTWFLNGDLISTEQNPIVDLGEPGTSDLGLIVCNNFGCDTIEVNDYITYDPTAPECLDLVMMDGLSQFSTACAANFSDDGGPVVNYENGVYSTLEVSPPNTVGFQLNINRFEVRSGDTLSLFINQGNGFILHEQFSGFPGAQQLEIPGSQMRFIWQTDASSTSAGFDISWTCLDSAVPSASFELETANPCNSEYSLADQSTNFPTSWSWLLDEELVSNDQNPTLDVAPGTYDMTLIACNNEGCDTSTVADFIVHNPDLPICQVIVMTDDLVTTSALCEGLLTDDGGLNGDYSNSVFAQLDVEAPGAIAYQIDLSFFNTEGSYDYLKVYEYDGTEFVIAQSFSGSLSDQTVIINSSRIRFEWTTDGSFTYSGYEVAWTCVIPTIPSASFILETEDVCNSQISLLDQSTEMPTSWSWLLNEEFVSNDQNPVFDISPGTYDMTLIACNDLGCDTSTMENLIVYNPEHSLCQTIVMTNDLAANSGACEGLITDDGGPDGNYQNSVFAQLDVEAPGATAYHIELNEFDTESGYDQFTIYAHDGTNFVPVKSYSGMKTGDTITVNSSLIRFVWSTDGSVVRPGFEATWTCHRTVAPIINSSFDMETCENTVHLSANSPNADQVTWNFGDGNTAEGMEVSHTYTIPGLYTVDAMATNIYGETPFSHTVHPDYEAVYFVAPDNMIVNESQDITISSPSEDQIQSIFWELDGEFITDSYAHAVDFSRSGSYELKARIIDINGCSSELVRTIEVGTVGTKDLLSANIRIQPNPTSELIQLLDLQNLEAGYSLALFNTVGQLVYQTTPAAGTDRMTVDMKDLPAGVYYLNIKSQKQRYQPKKVVKIN